MPAVIKDIWYNPANRAFEGRIDITRGGKSFRYPCSIEGPMNMAPSEVCRRMESKARDMSDTPPAVFSSL